MPITVPDLREVVAAERLTPLFATVSGAHLYGFPSEDSDVDLRGVHLLPAADVVGLRVGPDTIERSWVRDGVEIDLVTHDLIKFARLLLTPNGYVLEQLLSPLVVRTGPEHAELLDLAPGLLTSRHAHHYRGFARNQWKLFERTGEIKPLLYTFRALLTGIHLMRTGTVEANLPALGGPAYLADLIAAKRAGEHQPLADPRTRPHAEADIAELNTALDEAQSATRLPVDPTVGEAMHTLVVRTRLSTYT
ncbi:nucleotidyltransferase domain-containing protein [Actinokineospora sp.]|uniref:nucleotidyltransferase domain-containing protein n=1 Tax=Actinokineospora sp. TaxID=1872133 RepID=UPI004037C745